MVQNNVHVAGLRTIKLDCEERMRQFDELPPLMRKVLRESPYNFNIVIDEYHKLIADGYTDKIIESYLQKSFKKMIATETLRFYGPDHPQAANAVW